MLKNFANVILFYNIKILYILVQKYSLVTLGQRVINNDICSGHIVCSMLCTLHIANETVKQAEGKCDRTNIIISA